MYQSIHSHIRTIGGFFYRQTNRIVLQEHYQENLTSRIGRVC